MVNICDVNFPFSIADKPILRVSDKGRQGYSPLLRSDVRWVGRGCGRNFFRVIIRLGIVNTLVPNAMMRTGSTGRKSNVSKWWEYGEKLRRGWILQCKPLSFARNCRYAAHAKGVWMWKKRLLEAKRVRGSANNLYSIQERCKHEFSGWNMTQVPGK